MKKVWSFIGCALISLTFTGPASSEEQRINPTTLAPMGFDEVGSHVGYWPNRTKRGLIDEVLRPFRVIANPKNHIPGVPLYVRYEIHNFSLTDTMWVSLIKWRADPEPDCGTITHPKKCLDPNQLFDGFPSALTVLPGSVANIRFSAKDIGKKRVAFKFDFEVSATGCAPQLFEPDLVIEKP